MERTCCPADLRPPGCVCPAPGIVTVDFKILNQTTKDSPKVFIYYSQQYYDSDPDKDTLGLKPHMFVAGAKYHFMVFHGGVLVYNYTITLPRPYETKTVLFNETTKEIEEVPGESYAYTWLADGKGSIKHPIMVFTGSKSWKDTGKRADATLKLVTWVQTLEVKTLTNAGKFTRAQPQPDPDQDRRPQLDDRRRQVRHPEQARRWSEQVDQLRLERGRRRRRHHQDTGARLGAQQDRHRTIVRG